MELTLTKRVFVVWDGPAATDLEFLANRDAFIDKLVVEGKTNGQWIGTARTTIREFTDQAAAEEWLAWVVANNVGRTLISQSITDI